MNQVSYNKDYYPPAPVLPVKRTVPGEAHGEITQIALIDTGADGTFIPTAILEELELPFINDIKGEIFKYIF